MNGKMKDFLVKTYQGALGYLMTFPLCLIGLFFFGMAASVLLGHSPLRWLLHTDGAIPFSTWMIGLSYLALLTAALFWICSPRFSRCSNWWFWGVSTLLFLVFSTLTLCYLEGAPFYDCSGFHTQALRLVKRCDWQQIKNSLYPGNVYITRGFWCWYLPYKLFGESVKTITCVNLFAWWCVSAALYGIIRVGCGLRGTARAALLLCLFCPIGYFIAPAPMACNIGLAYAGCAFFVLALIVHVEKRLLQNPPVKRVWLGKYLIPLMLAVLLGIFLMLAEGSRNLGTHQKTAILVYLLFAGLWNVPKIKKTWKTGIRIAVSVIIAFSISPLIMRCIFQTDISRRVIQQQIGKAPVNINWLFTINGKELQLASWTNESLTNAIYQRLPRGEFQRELINNRFLYPLKNGGVNENYYTAELYRFRSLAYCYGNITSFIKCAPKQDPEDFKFLYEHVYQMLRGTYLLLLGVLGFWGTWTIAKYSRVANPILTMFFFSFCIFVGCMTIAEAGPKIGFLTVPTMILAGSFSCIPSEFPASRSERQTNDERKRLLPVFCFGALLFLVLLPVALKVAYCNFYPVNMTEMKFTPGTIGPCKVALSRWKPVANRTALLLPDGVDAGTGVQKISHLVPNGKYYFLAYLRSTLPQKEKNPYVFSLSCNENAIYRFDSQKDKGLFQFQAKERFEKKVEPKIFHLIYCPVSADANGEIVLKIDAQKGKIREPLFLMMMDVELIPAEK